MPAQYGGVPCEKPEPRARTKRRVGRVDAKKLREFRDHVWAREATKFFEMDGHTLDGQWARCQQCLTVVVRSADWMSGEVDHIIPRSRCTPEQRYDPANGRLLCNGPTGCHRKKHEHRS